MRNIKKIGILSLSALFIFSIASCGNQQNVDSNKYTEKEVNVFYKNTAKNHKSKLRFYEETKDIPYIGIKEYYNILVKDTPLAEKGDLIVTKNNTTYKVETPKGGLAEINTLNDTFETDNFMLFNSTNFYDMSSDNGLFQFDGMPWVKVKNVTYNKPASLFKVNFKNYKINLFGDNNDVYFPFNTASDLFLNENLLNCAYNHKDIYVVNGSYEEDISNFGNDYVKPIFENKLSDLYSEYNYMEFCFAYDKLLGRPGRSSIERNFDLSKGLDYALSNNNYGKKVKELFLSSDVADYFIATQIFNKLFGDGGHSNFIQYRVYCSLLTEEEQKNFGSGEIYKKILEKSHLINEIKDAEPNQSEQLLVRTSREKALGLLPQANSSKVLRGTQTYYKQYDTAIIFIDDFMGEIYNRSLWNEYYSGKRETIPYGDNLGGTVASIYSGLKKAREDNVKNVIIDLSSNTGGSIDELTYLCAILTNKKQIAAYHHTTGQIMVADLDIDINLDKIFDEKDNLNQVYGFNLAVLSSKNGFSCGGISPIYLHESNIFTMGDDSGGGSCSIYYIYDAYGLPHIASSPHQMITFNGASIDAVRNTSCDLHLEITDGDNGLHNYEAFFQIGKLTQEIENHYKK